MKVDGPRAVESGTIRRAGRPGTAQSTFSLDRPVNAQAATPVSAPISIGAVDALLALQAAPDAMSGRSRAVRRGQNILDLLDDIRDGLLLGHVSVATVNRLTAALKTQREGFVEPELQAVMDDIELRAHVELAKLGIHTPLPDSRVS